MIVVIKGRWSLPMCGPVLIVALRSRSRWTMVRSMVDWDPLDGHILVLKSTGVRIQALSLSISADAIALPAVLFRTLVSIN